MENIIELHTALVRLCGNAVRAAEYLHGLAARDPSAWQGFGVVGLATKMQAGIPLTFAEEARWLATAVHCAQIDRLYQPGW